MRLATWRHWQNYGSALRFAAILGTLFGVTAGAVMLKPPLAGALFGFVSAVADFTVGMAFIGAAEIFLPRTRFGRALASLPFLAAVLAKGATYLAVVMVVIGGRWVRRSRARGGAGVAAQISAQIDAAFPRGLVVVVAAMVTLLLVLLRHAAQIVGERNFRDVVRGCYHRPRTEERFFLFIDIVGSTPVAERLGALAVHRYLNRIFQESSDPIDDQHGEVYQYVGDEIVVTWLVPEGREGREAARLPVRHRGGARAGGARVRARVRHGAEAARGAARGRGGDGRGRRQPACDRVPRRRDERHFAHREPDAHARAIRSSCRKTRSRASRARKAMR